MSHILWQDYMSVDQGLIDSDHKHLLQYLNDLEDALSTGHAKEAVQEAVDHLVAYANEHFAREEVLWEQNGASFNDLKTHHEKHQRLRDMVQAYIHAASLGAVQVGPNLHAFLRNWIMHHVMHEDMGLAHKLGMGTKTGNPK